MRFRRRRARNVTLDRAGRESLTVFFPAHDEAENLPGVLESALRVLPRITDDFEIIVVDDGSTDGTAAVVDAIRARDGRVRLVRHEKNLGYGAALRSGFAAATRDLVFFTDGDGQFDLEELPAFLARRADAPVVIGYRIDRQDSRLRRFNGFAWSLLVRLLLGVRSRDVDCAYKVFPRTLVQSLRLEAEGAMISTEMLARIQARGVRILEVGVHHRPRLHGLSSGANPAVILRAFVELFRLGGRLRRQR